MNQTKNKFILIVSIIILPLVLSHCRPAQKVAELPLSEILEGTWYSSFEEDSSDVKCFRKDGYKFPDSRGRSGMRFLSNGGFEQFNIAANDGIEKVKGSWKLDHLNHLIIHLYQNRMFNYKIKVIEANKNKLRWQVISH